MSGLILKITVHQLSRKQLFEAFCKDDVQDSRTNRIKTEVVTMLGLFWRCIPVVSKTLKSKYIAIANFMFNRETCFSVPGWSAGESSRSLEGKSHLQLNFCEEFPERAAVTQHSWLSPAPAGTPEELGLVLVTEVTYYYI